LTSELGMTRGVPTDPEAYIPIEWDRHRIGYGGSSSSELRGVALGFESPLFVPVPADPFLLDAARVVEGIRLR